MKLFPRRLFAEAYIYIYSALFLRLFIVFFQLFAVVSLSAEVFRWIGEEESWPFFCFLAAQQSRNLQVGLGNAQRLQTRKERRKWGNWEWRPLLRHPLSLLHANFDFWSLYVLLVWDFSTSPLPTTVYTDNDSVCIRCILPFCPPSGVQLFYYLRIGSSTLDILHRNPANISPSVWACTHGPYKDEVEYFLCRFVIMLRNYILKIVRDK